MKTFNWEEAQKIHSKERFDLMKTYHNKSISESEWVSLIKSLPPKKLHNSQSRSPSRAKKDYTELKNKFGFFIP